jgi:hypothetical protein
MGDDPSAAWVCRVVHGRDHWYREGEDAGACIRQRRRRGDEWTAEVWHYGNRTVERFEEFDSLERAKATIDWVLGTG